MIVGAFFLIGAIAHTLKTLPVALSADEVHRIRILFGIGSVVLVAGAIVWAIPGPPTLGHATVAAGSYAALWGWYLASKGIARERQDSGL